MCCSRETYEKEYLINLFYLIYLTKQTCAVKKRKILVACKISRQKVISHVVLDLRDPRFVSKPC